jgi:hypothetical protein
MLGSFSFGIFSLATGKKRYSPIKGEAHDKNIQSKINKKRHSPQKSEKQGNVPAQLRKVINSCQS